MTLWSPQGTLPHPWPRTSRTPVFLFHPWTSCACGVSHSRMCGLSIQNVCIKFLSCQSISCLFDSYTIQKNLEGREKFVPLVMEQPEVCPCGALMHDPTLSVKGNRALFIRFQPQGGWQHSCCKSCSLTRIQPCSPWDPALPLLPTNL